MIWFRHQDQGRRSVMGLELWPCLVPAVNSLPSCASCQGPMFLSVSRAACRSVPFSGLIWIGGARGVLKMGPNQRLCLVPSRGCLLLPSSHYSVRARAVMMETLSVVTAVCCPDVPLSAQDGCRSFVYKGLDILRFESTFSSPHHHTTTTTTIITASPSLPPSSLLCAPFFASPASQLQRHLSLSGTGIS